MAGNLALDTVVGSVPLLGDLFDLGFKSNLRNLALLDRWLDDPRRVERSSRRLVIGLAFALAAFMGLGVYAVVRLVGWLWAVAVPGA